MLTLHCALCGRRDGPRRTPYAKMLAQPVVRPRRASALCGAGAACADLLFAATPTGGVVGFAGLPRAAADALQGLLAERVAAAVATAAELTPGGGVVIPAVPTTELTAVAVEAATPSKGQEPPETHIVEAMTVMDVEAL